MSGNKEEAGERREREREAEKIAGAVPPFRHTSRCLRLSLPRCFSLFHFRPCLPVAEILRRSKVEASTFTLARRHAAGIYDAPFIGKRSFHSRGLRVWLFGRVNVARMSSSIFRLSLSLSFVLCPVCGRASSSFQLVRDEERPAKSRSWRATLLSKWLNVPPCWVFYRMASIKHEDR